MAGFKGNGGGGRGKAGKGGQALSNLVEAIANVIVLSFFLAAKVTAVGKMVEMGIKGLSANTGLAKKIRREARKKKFALKGESVSFGIESVRTCGTGSRMYSFAHMCVGKGGKAIGDSRGRGLKKGGDEAFLVFAAEVTLEGAEVKRVDKGMEAVRFVRKMEGHELCCQRAECGE